MSLVSTLPVRVSACSVAVTAFVSFTAFGTSSTMLTTMVLVVLLPSESVAW